MTALEARVTGRPSRVGAVLSRRALNRATLERQLLTRRVRLGALEAVRHLAGLQGQEPDVPYLSLWTRLDGFGLQELTRLLHDRKVVRATLYRGTQHLVTAEDYLWVRPLLRPVLDRLQRFFAPATAGIDLAELAAEATRLLAGRRLTRAELGTGLAARWPGYERMPLAQTAQALLAVVHPPPSGTWGHRGAIPFVLAEEWIGRPLAAAPSPAALVCRYLAAFGPATVMDVQKWSGLTRLREVVDPLRPRLRAFRDEAGRELFDLPDAPRPDPDTPLPVRLLPEFDNLVISYADRTRVLPDAHRGRVCIGGVIKATVLVDGVVRGTWQLKRDGEAATLAVELLEPLSDADRAAVTAEGVRLLGFAAADASRHDVRFQLGFEPG